MLFGDATEQQVRVMMKVLNMFCAASGEKVNLSKSKMLVSSNICIHKARILSKVCKIPLTTDFDKYLGTPMIHGRVTKSTYMDIISKAQAKLHAWENKPLSIAGRITLIKSVMSALPCYLMQTTFLPEFVTSELDKLIRTFLWGGTSESRKLHLINWDKICLPKDQGGLGLRKSRSVNLSFLAKLGWKILQDNDNLWIEVMKMKYLRKQDFLTVTIKGADSYTWKSIIKGRMILQQGLGMNVYNGKSTKFWLDEWLPGGALINKAIRVLTDKEANSHVADFLDATNNWDVNLLNGVVGKDTLDLIKAKWVDKHSPINDDIFWKHTDDGNFTVGSAYNSQLEKLPHPCSAWKNIWALPCTGKMKLFLWKIFQDALPTFAFLVNRNLSPSLTCFLCSDHEETISHAIRDCAKSKAVWLSVDGDLRQGNFFNLPLKDWLSCNVANKRNVQGVPWHTLFTTAAWLIWYWRNCQLHDQDFLWPPNACQQIWTKAREMRDVLCKFSSKLNYNANITWSKPSLQAVKLNVDASVNIGSGVALAGVIRDNKGAWLSGFSSNIGICSTITAELWAVYKGLHLCWDLGYKSVELETNSMQAVNKITTTPSKYDTNGNLLVAIQDIMKRNWQCIVKHVYRKANTCVDWMAKNAASFIHTLQVFEEPPQGLDPLLMADALGVARSRYM
ncbi:hypothetical protein REPUB_Repub10bG0018300 [Reevesia pubescens]